MTTRPEWRIGSHLLPGIAAIALFVVMAAVFVTAPFGTGAGFPEEISVVEHIGFALLNVDLGVADVRGEGFLVAFIAIALVLDAAIEGSIMLAARDEEEAATDGGRGGER